MKFDSSWYLKWVEVEAPQLEGKSYNLVNLCVLVGQNQAGSIVGLTVFEPRDLTEAFLARLESRRSHATGMKFCFYLPPFLKHRAESLKLPFKTDYTAFVRLEFKNRTVSIRSRLRIMNVDDSPVLLKFLNHILTETGFVDVVKQVSDPLQAVSEIQKNQPDVITMDIQMPRKTGVEVVKDLLTSSYFPVIMVSSLALEEGSLVFEALNSGAFDYVQKPKLEEKESFRDELLSKIFAALENRRKPVVRSFATAKKSKAPSGSSPYAEDLVWCIGSSTGGTQALTQIFTSLPDQIPATFIVQHIPPVFSKAFAESLNALCPFTVKEAESGEQVKPNHVYIAPGAKQMGFVEKDGRLLIAIRDDEPVNRFKPSVDYMFSDLAKKNCTKIVAGILTGMGKDGAQGLLTLKEKGALTFAQDESTSAVYGMPREAALIGATKNILPLDTIAEFLLEQSTRFRKVG